MAVTTAMIKAVSSDQIGRCTKIFEGSKPCYMVLSESDDLTEYKVRATRVNGKWIFTCTCPSGKDGFANVTHPSGVCKHVRWSLAAAQEEKDALAEQVALNEAAKQVKPVETAKPKKSRKFDEGEALYQSRMRGIADILAAKRMAGLK